MIATLPKYDFSWTGGENRVRDGTVYYRILRLTHTPAGMWESVVCIHPDAATTFKVGDEYVSSAAPQNRIRGNRILWRPPSSLQRTSAGYGPAS